MFDTKFERLVTFSCFLARLEYDDELLFEVGDGEEVYYCLFLGLKLIVTFCMDHIDH